SEDGQPTTRRVGQLASCWADWHCRRSRAGRDRATGKSFYHRKYSDGRWRLDCSIMKTTQHLDDPKTAGRPAPAIEPEECDLLILGSGAAGKLLSWTLAKKGMKTVVVERKYIGGSCPNIACLPSKNVIHSAMVASYFRRSEEFGITKGAWKINMAA